MLRYGKYVNFWHLNCPSLAQILIIYGEMIPKG